MEPSLNIMIWNWVLIWLGTVLQRVGAAIRLSSLEDIVIESQKYEDTEAVERRETLYADVYSSRIIGMKSPFDALIATPDDPNNEAGVWAWLMDYDGSPFGMELLLFIVTPLIWAKMISLMIELIRPIPPCMDKAPDLPRIPLYYLQASQTERELKRPLRSGITWYSKNFIIRSDDDFIDRYHIRQLLQQHKKINTQSTGNAWHIVRLLLRMKQFKEKAPPPPPKPTKDDDFQAFLNNFAAAMNLTDGAGEQDAQPGDGENYMPDPRLFKAAKQKVVSARASKLAQDGETREKAKADALEAMGAKLAAHRKRIDGIKEQVRKESRELREEKRKAELEDKARAEAEAAAAAAAAEAEKAKAKALESTLTVDEEEELEDEESSSSSYTSSSDEAPAVAAAPVQTKKTAAQIRKEQEELMAKLTRRVHHEDEDDKPIK